ncbi:hypothetical protein MML48_2g00006966 [Holotrichia oblita]|uniref:Uncharacterized protein n=2 Tax=Holotrichia oblita TaxID=644536 RepID=A0ACB9TIK7_HOLOL|nr:hypothetical protein MML48_2g00007943 [Holotrichia oblita]KAI4466625.1 hypothetical protein MML48_2g00006966 [Holotrichia oblita]
MPRTGNSLTHPMWNTVRKFIYNFPELTYDGCRVRCTVCNVALICRRRRDCELHLNTKTHRNKRDGGPEKRRFYSDLCLALISCNIPFAILDRTAFIAFWKRYAECELPSRTSLRNCLSFAREDIERRIKSELNDKKLWLCVDETIDRKRQTVVNVMVRTMEPHRPSPAILLASKRFKKCSGNQILKVVLNSMSKLEISPQQIMMFVSEGDANMLSLAKSLKESANSNLLHITCKINDLNLVTQTIRKSYPRVNDLISSTKATLIKSLKRTRFHYKLSPDIPELPEPIITPQTTWLKSAIYYHRYFDHLKSIILKSDPEEAAITEKIHKILTDPHVKEDLQTIYNNYVELAEGIEKLQNVSISFADSVRILNDIHAQLNSIQGEKNKVVVEKFENVLNKNSDFHLLKLISEGATIEPLSSWRDYFEYANVTSLDVERSFSALKHVYTARRLKLSENTAETYLMLGIFEKSYPRDNGLAGS